MDNVYKCRLCYRMFHDQEVVIDLSSEEAKKAEIRAKILSALSIIVTDHDSLKYICRICYGQVEVNFQFVTKCRINNAKYIESLEHSPSNDVVRAEYNKFMKIPINALFNQYQFDVKGLFDAVTSCLNDNSENLRNVENFGINNHNSITTQFDIENDQSVGNGIPESSPVLEVNVPSTNEHNIVSNHIDSIHNYCVHLNKQSFRPIINTNNINNSTTSSTPRNIMLSTIPVISTNNSSNTINPGGNVYRVITNGHNLGTNNVKNRLVMNNTNQSRTNLPIVCKNNVIKSSRFCVLSNKPSPLLVNRRRFEKINIQNLGSATRLNQSNVNTPSIVQSAVNIHNNSVTLNGNGEINEISDDEVICLDDDDDDDDNDNQNHNDNNNNGHGNNNHGDGNNLQSLANSISPLNQWVTSQPQIIHTNNNNNNVRNNIRNLYQYKNKKNTKKIIQIKRKCLLDLRKVVYIRNNAPSTNSEEMTVTPDMPISTSDMGSPVNQEEEYIDVDSEPLLPVEPEQEPQPQPDPVPEPGPSRVLPDTGFHFLFSTDETVDLTTKEDTTPIKIKPIIRQKKTPKPRKAVASKKQTQKTSIAQQDPKAKIKLLRSSTSSTIEKKQTRKTSIAECNLKSKSQLLKSSISPNAERLDTSLTKARPKRASAIGSAAVIKNSGLFKLGKQREGYWTAKLTQIPLPMFQCPICHKYYYSLKSRKAHETSMHSSLLETIHEPVNIVSSPGNSACTQQLYLFNYLQLCQTSKNKTETVHLLAKKTYLLNAFNCERQTIIGFFQCTYCPFDTNLVFACWAHMTSYHLNCVSEKKSCLFCFVCWRILTKRTTMLKHLDGCILKQYALPIDNSCDRFMCVHCDDSFDSLIELDDHTWEHEDRFNY